MTVVDVIDLCLGLRVGKVKFLTDGVVLVNILGSLDLDVQLIPINGIGDGVAEVLQLVHPWEHVPTQQQPRQLPWLPEEGHQLGLALGRVWICGKLQIVTGSILSTGVEHVLQGIERGGQEPVIITVTKDSMVVTKYPPA